MLIYWCFKRLFIYYLGSGAVYYTKIDGLVPFSIEIQAEESMIEQKGNIREGSHTLGPILCQILMAEFTQVTVVFVNCPVVFSSSCPDWVSGVCMENV